MLRSCDYIFRWTGVRQSWEIWDYCGFAHDARLTEAGLPPSQVAPYMRTKPSDFNPGHRLSSRMRIPPERCSRRPWRLSYFLSCRTISTHSLLRVVLKGKFLCENASAFNTSLSDLVFFVMRTILYFLGFCVRLHYFLYYLSFMFNQFFTKCIVSSPSFSFFLCVKMSVWIVSNVSRVLHTFVNSVIVN